MKAGRHAAIYILALVVCQRRPNLKLGRSPLVFIYPLSSSVLLVEWDEGQREIVMRTYPRRNLPRVSVI